MRKNHPTNLDPPLQGVFQSSCPLDCPDACSLEVTVDDGIVVKLQGDRRNPLTDGLICGKVRSFDKHLYCQERLLRPALRTGPKGSGEFQEVSWEQALEKVATGLKETAASHGGEAILPFCYGGSNGMLSQDATDFRLFARLGASKLLRTVCAAPSGAAHTGLYGKMPGVDLTDYPSARLIVVWGCNPEVTGIHLLPQIRKARDAGARLVVIDPRRTKLAAQADLHLAPRPGTDLPLALSLIQWMFEQNQADLEFLAEHASGVEELRRRASGWSPELAARVTGVPREQIESLARWYAETSPAVIRCGWGVERNRNGGSAVAAILALPAVGGKFGVRGGGFTMSQSGAFAYRAPLAAKAEWSGTREVNMNRLGATLALTGADAVRLLFVYNANPLATIPDQQAVRSGLEREDLLTVVFDQVLTDTARYADVILPATTFLERTELRAGYGSLTLSLATPVIAPVGQARSNHEVFAELCRLTGVAQPGDPESAAELNASILMGAHPDELMRVAMQLQHPGVAVPPCGPQPILFQDLFPATADGKIHLVADTLDQQAPDGLYAYQPDPGSADYPLALISPAHYKTVSSTFGQLHGGLGVLEIGEHDARERGVVDGDTVRVFNDLGEVICTCHVDQKIREGVVSLPKGLWLKDTLNGQTSNSLAPADLSDLGGGACFSDARVQVEKH